MPSTTSCPENGLASSTPAKPRYACQRCTNCCRWPGFVKLTDSDISAISKFLGLSEVDFIQEFTRLRPRRDGLALTDQPDGACIFLEGRDCRIQPVKPIQCSGFPNEWNFPGWRELCEAIEV
jgi:Fe-S-cluster containining protein